MKLSNLYHSATIATTDASVSFAGRSVEGFEMGAKGLCLTNRTSLRAVNTAREAVEAAPAARWLDQVQGLDCVRLGGFRKPQDMSGAGP